MIARKAGWSSREYIDLTFCRRVQWNFSFAWVSLAKPFLLWLILCEPQTPFWTDTLAKCPINQVSSLKIKTLLKSKQQMPIYPSQLPFFSSHQLQLHLPPSPSYLNLIKLFCDKKKLFSFQPFFQKGDFLLRHSNNWWNGANLWKKREKTLLTIFQFFRKTETKGRFNKTLTVNEVLIYLDRSIFAGYLP